MKIEFSSSGVLLAKDQTLRLPAAQGARIAAEHGTVWITQDGDQRDIVLGEGESFVLDRDTPAVVQAIDAAQITIAEPVAAPQQRSAGATWLAHLRGVAARYASSPAWA